MQLFSRGEGEGIYSISIKCKSIQQNNIPELLSVLKRLCSHLSPIRNALYFAILNSCKQNTHIRDPLITLIFDENEFLMLGCSRFYTTIE